MRTLHRQTDSKGGIFPTKIKAKKETTKIYVKIKKARKES